MNIDKLRHYNGELSGSIGDLGTFLPYVIGAIAIGGFDATGVFTMFGLMYIFTGLARVDMAAWILEERHAENRD